MQKWLEVLKDWLEVVGILSAWILALWGWSVKQAKRRDKQLRADIKTQLDGVGGRVNALEITVGQHETTLDAHDSDIRAGAADRQRLYEAVGGFKAEVKELRKTFEDKENDNRKMLTDIQVDIGKLTTKVDLLLSGRLTNHSS